MRRRGRTPALSAVALAPVSERWPGAGKDGHSSPTPSCPAAWWVSVQFSRSVVSDSLRPHESQHVRPRCPSPTPGVHPNPCPLNWLTPSNHLILCRPLLLLPSIFPSIRVFSNASVLLIKWPKYWSFSFSISHSNEYSRMISVRMDWLDLLAVQGTLKSLLQHHSSKAPIPQCSVFLIVQLSHPYMTTGKNTALARQIDLC